MNHTILITELGQYDLTLASERNYHSAKSLLMLVSFESGEGVVVGYVVITKENGQSRHVSAIGNLLETIELYNSI